MSLKISINQVDGFEECSTNAGCYLSLDGDFIDVITPITKSSDSLTEISTEGLLRLILKNMRSGSIFGSVTIHASKLKIGTYWLPLFNDIDDDFINNVPVNAETPRLEITVISDSLENNPVAFVASMKNDIRLEHLQREYEKTLKRAEERDMENLQKIKELADGQIALQIENNRLNSLVAERNLQITYLNERLNKASIESYEADYVKQKEMCGELTNELENAHEQIEKLDEEVRKYKEMNKSLNSNKINACHIHEEENQKLQQQVIGLKQKVFEMQKSEKKLSEKLESDLTRQIKDLNEKLEQSEQSNHDLYLEIADLKNEISNQEKIINYLKGHTEGSKTDRPIIRDDRTHSPKNIRRKDSIDQSLEEYHTGHGIKNNFNKFNRGVYEFGNRKVNVSLKNGSIVCRVGGGYIQIDDFLKIYSQALINSQKKTVNPRGQSTSPVRSIKSFSCLESPSGKQTPLVDQFPDNDSLLTYNCDIEENKKRPANKNFVKKVN
ncbi:hypothetical protein SteCoe_19997 [Stentor coeruleus]|uniref:GAR domain-containing protein n=1 Tax=Stentor coeruleus TaxID=5963 RepID=A0A1R2BT65_9CILI|nr:hypothetical protein SteCoe_19997 [Stentor coeruleus]